MNTKKSNKNSNSIRKARNAAEKLRRDKLNTSIYDLANIVPFKPYANKRLDKISILRLSAAYLRLHLKYDFLNMKLDRKLEMKEEMLNEIIKTLNGFMLLLDNDRKIIFTSQNCVNYLGHQDIDMIGNNLDLFVHPFEIEMINEELNKLKIELNSTNNSKSKSIILRCRMKTRIQPKAEYSNYQFMQLSGYMINLEYELNSIKSNTQLNVQKFHPYQRPNYSKLLTEKSTKLNSTSSQRNQFISPSNHQNNSKYLFIGFAEIIEREPFEKLTLFESLQNEYVALFTLDCQIISVDHRISSIIGYLPKEIVNNYLNQYIHTNDQLISKLAHQMMLDSTDGMGKIVHRIQTKSGNYVYIESIGKLNFDKSRIPHNFVCYSRLLSDAEGEQERAKLVQKFSLQLDKTNDYIPFEYNVDDLKEEINPNSKSTPNNLDQIIKIENKSSEYVNKNLVFKISTTTANQQLNLLSSNSTTFLKFDSNLLQNSSLGFLIFNQKDTNKFIQQSNSNLCLNNQIINQNTNQQICLSSNLIKNIDTTDKTNKNNEENLIFLECSNSGSFNQTVVKCY